MGTQRHDRLIRICEWFLKNVLMICFDAHRRPALYIDAGGQAVDCFSAGHLKILTVIIIDMSCIYLASPDLQTSNSHTQWHHGDQTYLVT